jgi:two-component system chemotaxis response regulator CheY
LIVDDSAVMRKVVERSLRESGLGVDQVVQATNGLEALEILRQTVLLGERLDVIVCDIIMPQMDGLTFLETMRREGLVPGTPVVMLTTEGSQIQVRRAAAAGARGYICKPFTADQVRNRLEPLLRDMALTGGI